MRIPHVQIPLAAALLLLAACGDRPAPAARDSAAPTATTSAPAPASTSAAVAVMVESPHEDIDPCGFSGIRPSTTSKVAVRSGPGDAYTVVDSLAPQQRFASCDGRAGATEGDGWTGIIYRQGSPSDEFPDCGAWLSSPVPEKRAYTGPCRSGWIRERDVELLAG